MLRILPTQGWNFPPDASPAAFAGGSFSLLQCDNLAKNSLIVITRPIRLFKASLYIFASRILLHLLIDFIHHPN